MIPRVSYELGVEQPGLAIYFSMHLWMAGRLKKCEHVDPESQIQNLNTQWMTVYSLLD